MSSFLHCSTGPTGSLLQCRFSLGSPRGCRLVSAPQWTPMGYRGCFTMGFTLGCREISALKPGAPPPPSCDLGICRAISLTHYHFCLLVSVLQVFFLFLNMWPQSCYQCPWLVWPCSAVSLSWNRMALASSDIGKISGSCQKVPL